ncbi:VCBS repeat-containing protein [Pseudoalteromonas sp. JBTF-M23]|uniref:VCBS repeat-containing protein n=1 Tax=Pseudoalteromonas caenipelagi TaxID=2726988 RepID=A0A849VGV6_9GAMM|nr:VCBS repeat-containing protein [Pseudoalteromonas caenipelagi]NOU51938.1 VCBS repeat-containing protein [Pseudoalteromonas caenipelagi]
MEKRSYLLRGAALILTAYSSIASAVKVHTSDVPWKYSMIDGKGQEYNNALVADLDGNGTDDIVLQEVSDRGYVSTQGMLVLLSRATAGAGKYDENEQRAEWSSLFNAGTAEFRDQLNYPGYLRGFSSVKSNLFAANMASSKGVEIFRQNKADSYDGRYYASDFYTVDVHGAREEAPDKQKIDINFRNDLVEGLVFIHAPDELAFADFDHDGLDDIFVQITGIGNGYKKDGSIYYNKNFKIYQNAPIRMADGSDGIAQQDLLSSSGLLNGANAHIRFGDFNGDGYPDILRWDKTETSEFINVKTTEGHSKIDIWFGLSTPGTFKRSYLYLDGDFNHQKNSNDPQVKESFKKYSKEQVRIGDFNGDGSDDIVFIDDYNYTVYISHAVKVTVDQAGKETITRSTDALFSSVTVEDQTVYNNTNFISIADFNNDGMDDIGAWNGIPYILYASYTNTSDTAAQGLSFTGIESSRTIDQNGSFNNHFSGYTSSRYHKMAHGDFNNDGYTDILLLPKSTDNPVVYLTPPYNPLSAINQPSYSEVNHMTGLTYKNKNFVFFAEGNDIKYIYKDEHGWSKAQTLPFYHQNNDSRCNNDKPENTTFLTDATLAGVDTKGQGKYFSPVCNASYDGQVFDVTSDGQYLYLFRANGYANNSKVLAERFDFAPVDKKLIRLSESRYKLSGKRYASSQGSEVITTPGDKQNFTESADISTKDSSNMPFYEPAFIVPFSIGELSNDASCKVTALSASTLGEGKGQQRFVVTTAVSNACSSNPKLVVASYRKGSEQIFDNSDYTYLQDGKAEKVSPWYHSTYFYARNVRNLDTAVVQTSAPAVLNGEQGTHIFDRELVISSAYEDEGDGKVLTYNLPLDKLGQIKNDTPRGWSFTLMDTDLNITPRLYEGTDGLLYNMWRRDSKGDLVYNVKDTTLIKQRTWRHEESAYVNMLVSNWGETEGDSVRTFEFPHSWPVAIDDQPDSLRRALMIPRDAEERKPPQWSPKFGTFFRGNDMVLAKGVTPMTFTGGRLSEFGGQKQGIMIQEYVEPLKQADGRFKFAFSEVPMGKLKATFNGRHVVSTTPYGYIEGAPPVPRENLGRDQNGRWGYSGALADVEIEINIGTTVSNAIDSTGGGKVSLYETAGIKTPIVSSSLKLYVNASGGKIWGNEEEFSLSKTIVRKSFMTGNVPGRVCEQGESAYLQPCYETDDKGNKTVELWAPHTEGTLFVSTLSASRYALHHPETGRLVGYVLDFSDAAINDETINFKMNPNYLVAGSLDGFIGPKKVNGVGQSYFNPREELVWRIKDKRQQDELLARHNAAKTDTSGTSAQEFINDKLLISEIAVSDGGFQSKNEIAAGSITDHYGFEANVDFGVDFEVDSSGTGFGVGVGGYFSRTFKQAKDTQSSISFVANIDHGVTSEVQDENNNTLPWAVDKYNSRSYFLPASAQNLNIFFDKVVSPHLLTGENIHDSEIQTAALLKKLRASSVPVWRVTHRVDGVSRYIPNPN